MACLRALGHVVLLGCLAAPLRAQADSVRVVPASALTVQPARLNKPAMNYGRSGPAEVVLTYVIDTSGAVDVHSVRIISATDSGYARAASDLVRRQLFSRSRYDGAAVRVLVQQRVAFSSDMSPKPH